MNGTVRSGFSERTAWARNLRTPLRNFLNTESSSAVVLLGAALAALAWANIDHSSYEDLWRTRLSFRLGDSGISQDLRQWVNNGLMTFSSSSSRSSCGASSTSGSCASVRG